MKKEEWTNFLKYLSPYSILVVTHEGKLVEIHCPFRVKVLGPIGELGRGKIYMVDKVMVSNNLKTVFMIKGNAFYYYHFEILI